MNNYPCKYHYMTPYKNPYRFPYNYHNILCHSYRCIPLGNCQYTPRIRLDN